MLGREFSRTGIAVTRDVCDDIPGETKALTSSCFFLLNLPTCQATPRDGPFEQISAGAKYTCGIKVDDNDKARKKLECWGLDGIGMVSTLTHPSHTVFFHGVFSVLALL
jgi:hypothetical protein